MKYFVSISVFVLIAIGFSNQFLEIFQFEEKDENRVFHEMPDFDVNRLDPFGNEVDAFINDHFSFREPLLDLYHFIKVKVFNISPKPEIVIKGKEGWLFSSEGKYMDLFMGLKDTSELYFQPIIENWEARKEYLDQNNISLYIGVIPSKLTAYSDKMTFYYSRMKSRNQTDVFIKKMQSLIGDNILDFRITIDSIRKTRPEELYYRKLDNHWNMKGAYYSYQALINEISKKYKVPRLDSVDFVWEEYEVFNGFYAKSIGYPNMPELNWKPVFKEERVSQIDNYDFEPPKDFPYPESYQTRFKLNYTTKAPRVLVIHDSFTERMIPFLKHSFSESLFIFDGWQYGFNKMIIDEVKPDIVVYLTVEYLIENLRNTALKENTQDSTTMTFR